MASEYLFCRLPNLITSIDVCDSDIINPVCPLYQKPFALMSRRASFVVLAERRSNDSPFIGISCGSRHTSVKSLVKMFFTLSCLATNPSFLQEKACTTLKRRPHAYHVGRSFIFRFYRSLRASLNSSLFKVNPISSRGNAVNQELTPLSWTCFIYCLVDVGNLSSNASRLVF